ncbi:hypothetical protein [Bradyrhizobium cenepequi]
MPDLPPEETPGRIPYVRQSTTLILNTSDFGPRHRALPRIFANPKESQPTEITHSLFQSGSEEFGAPRITNDGVTVAKEIELDDKFVAQIKVQIEETTSDHDREKLQERLAKLAGGVAVIRVGGATEIEVKERKDRGHSFGSHDVSGPSVLCRKCCLPFKIAEPIICSSKGWLILAKLTGQSSLDGQASKFVVLT